MLGVDEVRQLHRPEDGLQLPPADAVLFQVNGLELDPPLLKIPLCLLRVETLGFPKDLDVHSNLPPPPKGDFCFL